MTTRTRTEIVMPGDTVQLQVSFTLSDGYTLADPDAYPSITIIQPSGNVVLGPTSTGVYRVGIGVYGYDLEVGVMGPLGIWQDVWYGEISGSAVQKELMFAVVNTQTPAINSDGYIHLGDDPGFNYSQNAIANINSLLKGLRARLKSAGKHRDVDEFGNVIYTDCDIFDTDQLVTFIAMALSMFNQVPHFTFFTFEDTAIIEQFYYILVQGATLIALSSQALIERGREFAITDNGIGFTPPTISEMLNTQWQAEMTNWYDQVKMIKHNMKPAGIGLGTIRLTAAAPQIMRLRHVRQRQIL